MDEFSRCFGTGDRKQRVLARKRKWNVVRDVDETHARRSLFQIIPQAARKQRMKEALWLVHHENCGCAADHAARKIQRGPFTLAHNGDGIFDRSTIGCALDLRIVVERNLPARKMPVPYRLDSL